MKYKYSINHEGQRLPGAKGSGRTKNPETWVTGTDPLRREKYYAFLKHRAQAKFRKENYTLTWEQWETLWTDQLFLKRGRKRDDYCLMMLNINNGWTQDNVQVVTRYTSLKRKGEYLHRGKQDD